MPDILLKDFDAAAWERVCLAAAVRGCPPEALAARAVLDAYGTGEDAVLTDRQDIATMRGIWNQGENQVFREAMEAFQRVDSGPLYERRSEPRKP